MRLHRRLWNRFQGLCHCGLVNTSLCFVSIMVLSAESFKASKPLLWDHSVSIGVCVSTIKTPFLEK